MKLRARQVKKQTGGRGKYGDAHIRIEPQERAWALSSLTRWSAAWCRTVHPGG